MPQFMVTVQHPANYQLPAGAEGEAMVREIHSLNREMIAAGVRDFAGGLQSALKARTVRTSTTGEVLVSDGPYLEAKEYIGGVWLLTCAHMDDAVAWARKATRACRVPVEVREFIEIPAEWKASQGGN